MRRTLRLSGRFAKRLIASRPARRFHCILFAALTLHIAWPGIRSTPPATPFAGEHWYNPYSSFDDSTGEWLKASFHSHGRVWLGLSWGENSNEELFVEYRRRGFDVVGISNYHSIRPPYPGEDLYVECYEHGWNAGGVHQTVLGSPSVRWLDVALLQTARHKQFVLDHLRSDAEVVILNHPNRKNSYSLDDMRKLSGYHGVEIRTRFAKGIDHWDAALSAGRPVWGFCADDCHSLTRGHVGNGWILVRVRERTRESLFDAIRRGDFVNVRAMNRLPVNGIRELEIDDGVLRVQLSRTADMIRFVGQDGRILHWVPKTGRAEYRLEENDTYVRIELNTRGTFIYLNPLFRYEDDPFAAHFAPTSSFAGNLLIRSGGALFALAVLSFGFPSLRWPLRSILRSERKRTAVVDS